MQSYTWEHVCSDSHPVPPFILVAPSLSSKMVGSRSVEMTTFFYRPPKWGGWKRTCLNHPEIIRKAVSQLTRTCIKGTLWAQWTSWEAFWRPGVCRSVLWWLGTMDQFWIRWYFGSSKQTRVVLKRHASQWWFPHSEGRLGAWVLSRKQHPPCPALHEAPGTHICWLQDLLPLLILGVPGRASESSEKSHSQELT